jgi:hypothetical protein
LRGGLLLRTDATDVTNTNTLLPVVGDVPVDAPFTVTDPSKKVGYTAGFYVQDEWRLTNRLGHAHAAEPTQCGAAASRLILA